MRKIKILTDSTADLSQELIQQHDLGILPLYVNIDNKLYRDGIDLTAAEMYEIAEKTKSHPKTSTAAIQEIYDFFIGYLKEDVDVIYTGIASGMSSSYQYAHMVKDMVEEKHPEYTGRMHIIDSANLSTGIGLLVLKICKWRDAGLTVEEIMQKAEEIKPKIRAQFCIEGLDYLHKGGRCSSTSKILFPPCPQFPPKGQPISTYFSLLKAIHPFPPRPAFNSIITSSINMVSRPFISIIH